MDKNIDKGKILDVKYFNLNKNLNINSLLSKTYKIMYEQSKEMIHSIIKNKINLDHLVKKNKKFKWSKKLYTRKNLNELYKINSNIKKNKLNNLLQACNTKIFKPYIQQQGKKFFYLNNNSKIFKPYIKLHGKKFFYLNK